MPNFGEQPTSTNRDRLSKNEGSSEEIKKQLAEAMASEDYDKVAELGGQMKSLKGQKEEFINKDEEEAYAENAERNMVEEAKTEDVERTKEKEKAEARAKELEEMKLKDEAESAEKAEEILKKINGGDNVEKQEPTKEIPNEVQQIIDKMKKKGYYENELPNLKPGEIPYRELTSRMIASVFGSPSNFKLEDAVTLMENLPYDPEFVKKDVVKEIMEDVYLDERSFKKMEIAGIDPASLHDDAVKQLRSLINLVAGERGEIRTPETLRKWRQTFNISDDEYANALHEHWSSRNGQVDEKYLRELGFIKYENDNTRWAWENKKA